jgi:predicted dienelactone hydrolase
MRTRLGTSLSILLAILAIGVGAAVPALAQTAPIQADATQPPAPGDAGPGTPSYAVGRRTIQVESEPGRTLTADVWYPADDATAAGLPKSTYQFPGLAYTSTEAYDSPPISINGPFPLVVYSHGSGGLRYISAFITEALAARGFVVVSVDHTGNTALDAFTKTTLSRKEIVRLRPIDIRAEIDTMAAQSADPASPFAGAVDTQNVGLVGHSAGGTGVLMTAAGHDGAPADKRVKAVVGLGTYVDLVTDQQLSKLKLPVMLISGTLDTSTTIKAQTERAAEKIPGDPLYRVDLKGGGHQSYSDVCYYEELAAATPGTPKRLINLIKEYTDDACLPKFLAHEKAHELIDRYTIGFFERYVANDKAAAKFLKPTDPKIVTLTVKD